MMMCSSNSKIERKNMIKLKEILDIASAHEFKIKNLGTGKVVWNDAKSVDGYGEMLEKYCDHEVVAMRVRTSGYARNNIKSILAIDIQGNGLL